MCCCFCFVHFAEQAGVGEWHRPAAGSPPTMMGSRGDASAAAPYILAPRQTPVCGRPHHQLDDSMYSKIRSGNGESSFALCAMVGARLMECAQRGAR